ncbi:hypothetical protein BLOT_009854 [Blomia tropicalis]|nr:hypothetical protein BLOT_009854 [Blomia tropicalis]
MDDDNTYFVRSMEEGHHAHTVVFDSPGCKPMLQQLQREFDVRYDNVEKLPIDFLDIASYLSAPNRVNTCNPHVGKIYRVCQIQRLLPNKISNKEFNENQCSLNVFSQSDQQFLKQYQVKHLEILNKLSIDDSNHLVAIQNESIVELYNTLSYDIKLLDYLKLTKSYNQLLIIEYNPNQFDNNDDLAKLFSSNLFVEIKNSKSCKIILCAKQDQILKNILSANLDELCKETKAEGFTWNDLNEESQKKLLNRKIVFQEKEKNLNDLIDVFNIKDEIGQLIDHDSLIKLINEDNKIEIGSKNFGIENLEGAYADLYKEVNNKTLKYNLIENSKKAIYFISGLFENNDENRALEKLLILNSRKRILINNTINI